MADYLYFGRVAIRKDTLLAFEISDDCIFLTVKTGDGFDTTRTVPFESSQAALLVYQNVMEQDKYGGEILQTPG